MVSELAPACCKSSQQKGLEGDQALVHRACLEDRGIRHAEMNREVGRMKDAIHPRRRIARVEQASDRIHRRTQSK